MKLSSIAAVLALGATFSLTAWAGPKLTINDVPEVVKRTIEREVKGVIDDIEWEAKDEVPHYEVEYDLNGEEWELEVTDDGRVLRHERD